MIPQEKPHFYKFVSYIAVASNGEQILLTKPASAEKPFRHKGCSLTILAGPAYGVQSEDYTEAKESAKASVRQLQALANQLQNLWAVSSPTLKQRETGRLTYATSLQSPASLVEKESIIEENADLSSLVIDF